MTRFNLILQTCSTRPTTCLLKPSTSVTHCQERLADSLEQTGGHWERPGKQIWKICLWLWHLLTFFGSLVPSFWIKYQPECTASCINISSVRATGSSICSLNKISLSIKIFGGDQLIFADIDAQGHGDHENQKKFVVIIDKGIGKTTKPAGCRSRHLYIGK